MGVQVRTAVSTLLLVVVVPACDHGCGKSTTPGSDVVVAKYDHGEITAADVQAELNRLPPVLRARFDSAAGRQDLASSLIDKRLLAREAAKRGLADDPEIRRQVQALEERLTIQALLAAEEKAAGEPSPQELQAYYDAHKQELGSPELVHVARILVEVTKDAAAADRAKARGRARTLAERLKKGEAFEKLASLGDGPERSKGGDMGSLIRGKTADRKLEDAAFSLAAPGATSEVIEVANGFAVLRLIARQPPRVPSLEEARSELLNRMAPARQRHVFDDLLTRLRKEEEVQLVSAKPR